MEAARLSVREILRSYASVSRDFAFFILLFRLALKDREKSQKSKRQSDLAGAEFPESNRKPFPHIFFFF